MVDHICVTQAGERERGKAPCMYCNESASSLMSKETPREGWCRPRHDTPGRAGGGLPVTALPGLKKFMQQYLQMYTLSFSYHIKVIKA